MVILKAIKSLNHSIGNKMAGASWSSLESHPNTGQIDDDESLDNSLTIRAASRELSK